MKTFYQLFLLTGYLIVNASCQKNKNIIVNDNAADISNKFKNEVPGNSLTTLKITTIAGVASHIGYIDGAGKQALFYNPIGIDLAADGFLYVADTYNDKIRKISLIDNKVTTVSVANANDGAGISGPYVLRVSDDGTINVIANEPHAVWIIKPGGKVFTPDHVNGGQISDIEQDPYYNFCWFAEVDPFIINNKFIKKAYLKKLYTDDKTGLIGTSEIKLSTDSIETEDRNDFDVLDFYPGYNGVKYIVINRTKLYKLTPSGSFHRIYKDFKFQEIYNIVSSKDSRTLYLAESGSIKCITNGVHKFLAGPNPVFHDGRDGIGANADIFAVKLALSKNENTLYFTDSYYHTIRKMQLN